MGMAFEVIDCFVTNPGVGPAFAAVTPFPGDTLAVRSFNPPSKAYLVDIWQTGAAATVGRVRSPRLHDNVQGIRIRAAAAAVARSALSEYVVDDLFSQDALIVEMIGGAAETDGFSLVTYYEDLPGVNARLHTLEDLLPRVVDLVNVEVAVAAAAPVGTRAVSRALNADFDLLVANTDYALLGYETDATGLSVGIRGTDTGNLRVGGPMTTEKLDTRDWFVRLSKKIGKPCIPVFNSANKAGILIDNAQVVAGVAANTTLVMARLAP